LIADQEKRATAKGLLGHPFLARVPDTHKRPECRSKSNDLLCFRAVVDIVVRSKAHIKSKIW